MKQFNWIQIRCPFLERIEKYILRHRKYLYSLAINLTILFIFSIVLQISDILEVQKFINQELFAWTVIVFDIIALRLHKKTTKNLWNKDIFKYGFLILLIVQISKAYVTINLLNIYETHLFILTIIFGFIIFYDNRNILNKIEKENEKELIEEQRRKKEFAQKYPKINKIPLLNNVVKWLHKEGSLYSYSLIILIALGFLIRIWNVGDPSFGDDEFTTVYVAKTYLETGEFTLPTGIAYTRAWLNIFFTAIAIKLFGFNEFSTRLPSVIFGTLVILVTYILGKKSCNKNVGLISAFIICLTPWQISWSREARMYAQTQFIYLIEIYLFYLTIKVQQKMRHNKYKPQHWLNGWKLPHMPAISIKWASVLLLTLTCAYLTHKLTILFVAVMCIYIIICYAQRKNSKMPYLIIASFIVLLLLLLPKIWALLPHILPYNILITIKPHIKLSFINYLLEYHTIITITGFIGMYYFIKNMDKLKLLIAFSFIIPLMITSSFLAWEKSKYIYHLFPLIIITSSYVFMVLLKIVAKKKNILSKVNYIVIILVILSSIHITSLPHVIHSESMDRSEINEGYGAMAHPDWKGLSIMFDKTIEDDDIIITTLPSGTYHYFNKKEGYWLRRTEATSKSVVTLCNSSLTDIYVGYKWINNFQHFTEIIENNHGYVIADHRMGRYYVSSDIINVIEQKMTLVASSGELKIYEFGHLTEHQKNKSVE